LQFENEKLACAMLLLPLQVITATTGYYYYYRLQQTSVGPCFLQKLTIVDAAGLKGTPFFLVCVFI